MLTSCIGLDSGKSVGMGFLDYDGDMIVGRSLIQVDWRSAKIVLEGMLHAYYADPARYSKRFAGVEPFVHGQAAGSKGGYADLTRQCVFELAQVLQSWGYYVKQRKAADVKPWASNNRLVKIGVLDDGKKPGLVSAADMDHACDGMRQALFAAHHDAYKPDPLRRY